MNINLTEYSKAGGCGCKLSSKELDDILRGLHQSNNKHLLAGFESNEDAAVYQIDESKCILSTTDFFTPIVDDSFTFGQISATNALSDIYAMGGRPIMAISILGWPIDKLPLQLAHEVLKGAISICNQVNVPLCGGHSINSSEPFFGLSVTGYADITFIKYNKVDIPSYRRTEYNQCYFFLTKPLGLGILTTAQKKKILAPEHLAIAIKYMTTINTLGERLGKSNSVIGMTDVTGYGLLSHLLEICRASQIEATLSMEKIPYFPFLKEYIQQGCLPKGGINNWIYVKKYAKRILPDSAVSNDHVQAPHLNIDEDNELNQRESPHNHPNLFSPEEKAILCDPQTSGGLLIVVDPNKLTEFNEILSEYQLSNLHCIGYGVKATRDLDIYINVEN